MRWIYLSPHLDDAILSCGGLIFEQTTMKIQVEIWTICAGDPPYGELSSFAVSQHTKWGTVLDPYEVRRREDIEACQMVGARYRHFPFMDCIYRQSTDGQWLYPSEESIFGELTLDDAVNIYTLRTFLLSILKSDDHLVVPLTVGNHVDHQLVRIAAEELDRPLLYYADAPYAITDPEKKSDITRNFMPLVYQFSKQSLASWKKACQAYNSQIKVLFESKEKMFSMLDHYYHADEGLRLWGSDQRSNLLS